MMAGATMSRGARVRLNPVARGFLAAVDGRGRECDCFTVDTSPDFWMLTRYPHPGPTSMAMEVGPGDFGGPCATTLPVAKLLRGGDEAGVELHLLGFAAAFDDGGPITGRIVEGGLGVDLADQSPLQVE